MLVKDTAAGVIQQLESFTAKYFTDNQGYASPPTSTEWPRPRTLTGADIPNIVNAVNGYGASAQIAGAGGLAFRNVQLTQTGTLSSVAGTSTTPIATGFTTAATATQSAGFTDALVGSRTLGILKSVKHILKLNQTTQVRLWIGVSASGAAATFQTDTPNTNFVGFRFSTVAGDTTFQCVTQTTNLASTKNAASPTVTIDTNPHTFEIQFDGTNAIFLVDGVQVGSQNGNIPATSVGLANIVFMDNVAVAQTRSFNYFSMQGTDYPTG